MAVNSNATAHSAEPKGSAGERSAEGVIRFAPQLRLWFSVVLLISGTGAKHWLLKDFAQQLVEKRGKRLPLH